MSEAINLPTNVEAYTVLIAFPLVTGPVNSNFFTKSFADFTFITPAAIATIPALASSFSAIKLLLVSLPVFFVLSVEL